MDCRSNIYHLVSQGYSLSDPYVIKNLYEYGYSAKEISHTINKHFDIDITIERKFIQTLIDLHKDRDLDNLPNTNNYWHKLNIDIAPLIVDLKDYILSDPYRPGEHASYNADTGGVWTLDASKLFSKEWLIDQKSLIALLLLIVVVSFLNPNFFTVDNRIAGCFTGLYKITSCFFQTFFNDISCI